MILYAVRSMRLLSITIAMMLVMAVSLVMMFVTLREECEEGLIPFLRCNLIKLLKLLFYSIVFSIAALLTLFFYLVEKVYYSIKK